MNKVKSLRWGIMISSVVSILLAPAGASALVQTSDIADGAVTSAKIAYFTISGHDLGTASVGARAIANQAIQGQNMGTNSVGTRAIADGSIQTADLGDGVVTGAKLSSDIAITTTGTLNAAGLTLTGSLVQEYGTSIASVAALPLSTSVGNVFTVTGTTDITSATAASTDAGRTVTLVFAGTLTLTDGSNLKLAGDFDTSVDDTITLVSNGTNWYEIARSSN